MTSKAYLVSWLEKGNIIWTPLEQDSVGLTLAPMTAEPLRSALDAGAVQADILRSVENFFDPSMALLDSIHSTVNVTAGLAAAGVGLQITV